MDSHSDVEPLDENDRKLEEVGEVRVDKKSWHVFGKAGNNNGGVESEVAMMEDNKRVTLLSVASIVDAESQLEALDVPRDGMPSNNDVSLGGQDDSDAEDIRDELSYEDVNTAGAHSFFHSMRSHELPTVEDDDSPASVKDADGSAKDGGISTEDDTRCSASPSSSIRDDPIDQT